MPTWSPRTLAARATTPSTNSSTPASSTDGRFFDVVVEYAKAGPEDILIRISATNRGPEAAPLHLLPTLWFRNTWSWGRHHARPVIAADGPIEGGLVVRAEHVQLGVHRLVAGGSPTLLFTENETNTERLYGLPNASPYVKDGIGAAVIDDVATAVNPAAIGTKAAAHYEFVIAQGATETIQLRLTKGEARSPTPHAEAVFAARIAEADAFYATLTGGTLSADEALVQRQAFAGLIWCKQVYHYDVAEWLDGDPSMPPPPAARLHGRNSDWRELNNDDVLSMPDSWEYPWYAAWDLAFHCLPLAVLDPAFAKNQLLTLTREWYMHPNGQLPAYEWAFSDVNPPVHAWAAWRVYKIDRRVSGSPTAPSSSGSSTSCCSTSPGGSTARTTTAATSSRAGSSGSTTSASSIAARRSRARPSRPGRRDRLDGDVLAEHARDRAGTRGRQPGLRRHRDQVLRAFPVHRRGLNAVGVDTVPLWDHEDQFFYDTLHLDSGEFIPLKVRSIVGLIPLLAVETLEPDLLERMPAFRRRMRWFLANRPDLSHLVASWEDPGVGERRLLALVHGHRMKALLRPDARRGRVPVRPRDPLAQPDPP